MRFTSVDSHDCNDTDSGNTFDTYKESLHLTITLFQLRYRDPYFFTCLPDQSKSTFIFNTYNLYENSFKKCKLKLSSIKCHERPIYFFLLFRHKFRDLLVSRVVYLYLFAEIK